MIAHQLDDYYHVCERIYATAVAGHIFNKEKPSEPTLMYFCQRQQLVVNEKLIRASQNIQCSAEVTEHSNTRNSERSLAW